ncbi:MAG: cytochrome b, partial [Pseudomonadota bacterium]
FFWILVLDVIVLTWAGGAHVTPTVVAISQIATAYYFAHFLIILPLISRNEDTLPLPSSISASALHGELQESAPAGTTKSAIAAAE